MQPHRSPGAHDPLFQSLNCPRCGTPLAVVAETARPGLEPQAIAIRSYARTLSAQLQLYQPGVTIPAYVVLRPRAAAPIEEVHLVWPEYHASVLTAESFAHVGPALLDLHRCLPLVRLY